MKITLDKIDELCNNEEVEVKFDQTDGVYVIKLKNSDDFHPIAAVVYEDGLVEYFVSNVYNSGVDYAKINIEELRELHKIIEGK